MARKSKPFMCPLAPGEGSSPPKLNPRGGCASPRTPRRSRRTAISPPHQGPPPCARDPPSNPPNKPFPIDDPRPVQKTGVRGEHPADALLVVVVVTPARVTEAVARALQRRRDVALNDSRGEAFNDRGFPNPRLAY